MVVYRLRRIGEKFNHKRVERLYYKELKLGLNKGVRGRRRLRSSPRLTCVNSRFIDERWSMDFVSDQLGNGSKFRVLTIVDTFSRDCIEVEGSRSFPSFRVVETLRRIFFETGRLPKKLQVDNGPEMRSKNLVRFCYEHGIELNFIQPGKPCQNGHIKSFRNECLSMGLPSKSRHFF